MSNEFKQKGINSYLFAVIFLVLLLGIGSVVYLFIQDRDKDEVVGLITIVQDTGKPIEFRREAMLSLSKYPTKEVISTLIELANSPIGVESGPAELALSDMGHICLPYLFKDIKEKIQRGECFPDGTETVLNHLSGATESKSIFYQEGMLSDNPKVLLNAWKRWFDLHLPYLYLYKKNKYGIGDYWKLNRKACLSEIPHKEWVKLSVAQQRESLAKALNIAGQDINQLSEIELNWQMQVTLHKRGYDPFVMEDEFPWTFEDIQKAAENNDGKIPPPPNQKQSEIEFAE